MKILTDYQELEGKTIAFTHMAQFAQQITIATTDNEVLMATFELDDDRDRKEIIVFPPLYVTRILETEEYLRKELSKRGIFDLEKYKEEMKAKQMEERKIREEDKKQRELKMLAELKTKYE